MGALGRLQKNPNDANRGGGLGVIAVIMQACIRCSGGKGSGYWRLYRHCDDG